MTGSADHSTSARNLADIHAIVVDLDVDSKKLLFILVGSDGSINRVGSGTFGNKNRDMFIGKTDPAIFQRVRPYLTDSMLHGLGMRFQSENPRGAPCKLTLMFQFNDGKSARSEYLYGAESLGPPREVADFVRAELGLKGSGKSRDSDTSSDDGHSVRCRTVYSVWCNLAESADT